MAIYQGARRRAALPLGLDALADKRDRARLLDGVTAGALKGRQSRAAGARRNASAGRRRGRPSSIGVALVAIMIVFSAAFLSLSQSVRVAATSYDIVRLQSEADRLAAIKADLLSDVQRLRSEPAIRKQGLEAGLGQLGAPLLIPAR